MVTYLVVSCISASFGVVIGGALGSSKASDLYSRLATAEEYLAQQTAVVEELTSAIQDVLSVVDGRLAYRVGPEAVANMRCALASCETIVSSGNEKQGVNAG